MTSSLTSSMLCSAGVFSRLIGIWCWLICSVYRLILFFIFYRKRRMRPFQSMSNHFQDFGKRSLFLFPDRLCPRFGPNQDFWTMRCSCSEQSQSESCSDHIDVSFCSGSLLFHCSFRYLQRGQLDCLRFARLKSAVLCFSSLIRGHYQWFCCHLVWK